MYTTEKQTDYIKHLLLCCILVNLFYWQTYTVFMQWCKIVSLIFGMMNVAQYFYRYRPLKRKIYVTFNANFKTVRQQIMVIVHPFFFLIIYYYYFNFGCFGSFFIHKHAKKTFYCIFLEPHLMNGNVRTKCQILNLKNRKILIIEIKSKITFVVWNNYICRLAIFHSGPSENTFCRWRLCTFLKAKVKNPLLGQISFHHQWGVRLHYYNRIICYHHFSALNITKIRAIA